MNAGLNALRARIPSLSENPDEVAKLLEARGFRVTRVVPLSEMLRPIVVGRVESVTQHPNADRLKVCSVDDGTEQRLQIVTGADNVVAGASYPLIRGGVTLPDGRKIKRGKLRGEVSEGMLGSADELELGTDHAGLYTLPDGFAPGTPLTDVIPTPGVVFVLEGNGEIDEVVAKLTGSADEPGTS